MNYTDYDDKMVDEEESQTEILGPPEIAFCVPLEKFFYRDENQRWKIDTPTGKKGIEGHLRHNKVPNAHIKLMSAGEFVPVVHGIKMIPDPRDVITIGSQNFINRWVPPTLEPAQAPWPTLSRVLDHLTKGDSAGREWLLHWIAAKVQRPTFLPKVAVVLSQAHGAGKGTLAYAIRRILGEENTAQISQGEIENKFNFRWAGKFFILADEVVGSDVSHKDVSEKLKILIDASEVPLEGKNLNQIMVTNQAAWLFASNKSMPVNVEDGDRRYTVFNNHEPLTQEYIALLNGSFETDRITPTPSFTKELQGFAFDLLNLQVNWQLIKRPYVNEARSKLIHASLPSAEFFVREAAKGGIYDLIERLDEESPKYPPDDRESWDFGSRGIATAKVYAAYRAFCKRGGMREMRDNRFGIEVNKFWTKTRLSYGGKQVNVYVIPDLPEKPPKPRVVQPEVKA